MALSSIPSTPQARCGDTHLPALERWRQYNQQFKATLWLFREFKASLGSLRPCLKKKKNSPLIFSLIASIVNFNEYPNLIPLAGGFVLSKCIVSDPTNIHWNSHGHLESHRDSLLWYFCLEYQFAVHWLAACLQMWLPLAHGAPNTLLSSPPPAQGMLLSLLREFFTAQGLLLFSLFLPQSYVSRRCISPSASMSPRATCQRTRHHVGLGQASFSGYLTVAIWRPHSSMRFC